jgi:hypothetical protein
VDAARTFAMAGFLEELAGTEVEIERVELVPGVYQPRAVVTLKARRMPGRLKRAVSTGDVDGASPNPGDVRLSLHMRLEWGDWYVADVAERVATARSP